MTRRALLAVALVALSATACSRGTTDASCRPGELATKTTGTLTLSTGVITRAPWVVGSTVAGRSPDPREGKGYDAALGFALAEQLGFDRAHVTWVATPFFESVAPGAKHFDVSINQTSASDERRRDVDLSEAYWVERPVVVTVKGRPLEKATTLAAVASTPLAVVAKTPATGLEQLDLDTVASLDDARRAVTSQGMAGLVTDYNTGLRLDTDDSQLVDGELVGLLPAPAGAPGFSLVLQKDSPLTSCVNEALAELRKDGTLERLESTWLVQGYGLHDLR